jgi:hypothetical protein
MEGSKSVEGILKAKMVITVHFSEKPSPVNASCYIQSWKEFKWVKRYTRYEFPVARGN